MRISINNWKLEPSLNALVHCETGEIQRLGEFHFILLDTLASHAGEVLTRHFLINEVWKNRVVGNNSLPTAIYALRVALGDDGKLQEIIKTIPKKGYMLNKFFIAEINEKIEFEAPRVSTEISLTDSLEGDSAQVVMHDESAPTEPDDNPSMLDVSSASETSPPQRHTLTDNKRVSAKKITTLIILIALLLMTTFAGLIVYDRSAGEYSPESHESINTGLNLYQEIPPENGRIKIFHLRRGSVDKKNETLVTHVRETLSHINQLLTDHNATLTIYYYNTIPKLSVDILLKNSCDKEYQLIMGIDNWQSNTNALGTVIYQEVERTLNEMPACN